jgi:hypothetical protein
VAAGKYSSVFQHVPLMHVKESMTESSRLLAAFMKKFDMEELISHFINVPVR